MSLDHAPSCAVRHTKSADLYQPKALFGTVPVNGQAIALFRICLALLALHDIFFEVLPYWGFLYSSHGVITAQEAYTELPHSFFNYSDNPYYQAGLLTIYIICLFGILVGFRARLCAFIAFLFFTALMERNIDTASNINGLMGCLFLWGCFLPLDRYWSIAAALRGDAQRTQPWPIIPIVAAKLQIVIIYLNSGLFKLYGTSWTNGEALQYVAQDQHFGSYRAAQFLSQVPDDILKIIAWTIIIFQLGFSMLVYMPWKRDFFRAIAIGGAVFMHLSFIIFLQVHQFPYLCFVYLLLLVPDRWIEKVLAKRRRKFAAIRIFYDPDCGFCRAISFIFREFCVGPSASVRPADEDAEAHALLRQHESWVVYGHEGNVYLKWEAVAYLMRQSPVFWIFGYLTDLALMKKPMGFFYRIIGKNRQKLGRWNVFLLNPLPERYPEQLAQIACLILLLITIFYTTFTLPQLQANMPLYLAKAAKQTHVRQKWDIFAPDIASQHFSFTVYGIDQDDAIIDLEKYKAHHYQIVNSYYIFNSHRILDFYRRMTSRFQAYNRKGYARYMCYMSAQDGFTAEQIIFKVSYEHSRLPGRGDNFVDSYRCADFLKKP